MTALNRSTTILGAVAFAAVATLNACGGGESPSGGAAAPVAVSDTVPAEAAASTEALVGYSQSLSADDTAEPVSLGEFNPPTDDTAEPKRL